MGFSNPRRNAQPIQAVAGQMMGGITGKLPGLMAFLQPQPVLQISTGATAHQQGQFAYAVSGINPAEVNEASEKLMGKLRQQMGPGKMFATAISDLFNHTPSLKIDILRDQAKTYNVSDPHPEPDPQCLQPELRLPDQAAERPVPGHP